MNERIREIVKQATEEVMRNTPSFLVTNEMWQEKFAELIIRECIGCCEQVISDPVPESVDSWLNGGEQCIQEIKQRMMPNLKE